MPLIILRHFKSSERMSHEVYPPKSDTHSYPSSSTCPAHCTTLDVTITCSPKKMFKCTLLLLCGWTFHMYRWYVLLNVWLRKCILHCNIFIVCMFMTCSTSYCLVTVKDLLNVYTYVCMYVWNTELLFKVIVNNYYVLGPNISLIEHLLFKYNQQDATLYNILCCCQWSTCFRLLHLVSYTEKNKLTMHDPMNVKLSTYFQSVHFVLWRMKHAVIIM